MNHKSLLFILFYFWASAVNATEGNGSNYLPGFYGDFAMANFPEPGVYFNNFFAAYQDKSATTGTLLEMPGVIVVSDHQIFYGQFVTGFFPALMAAVDRAGSNDFDRFGLGDFYFLPGGLNWKWKNVSAFLFEGVVAPTGRYEENEFNTGRNYWTFDHNLMITWSLPINTELSVDIGYMNNLENPATHYLTGDEFHFDYNIGYYISNNYGLGIAGSYYKQVTWDEAPFELNRIKAVEASSIGPVVMYVPRIGDRDVTISLKWLTEFNVSGRARQEYLVCKFMVEF